MGGVDVDGVISDGLVQRHQHVEAVLFGDPKAERLGLSQRMNSMEETIENKKLKWRWLVGWAAGVGATIAAIAEYLRGHEK
jgi:predicted Holliday junction resolvase-like endonuclease